MDQHVAGTATLLNHLGTVQPLQNTLASAQYALRAQYQTGDMNDRELLTIQLELSHPDCWSSLIAEETGALLLGHRPVW